MTKSPCCMLWSTLYGCKSHGFPLPEQTTKTRYVIQYRTQMVTTKTGEKYWGDWHDGAGYKPGEGGAHKYRFSNPEEARNALKLARCRKHTYVTEYKLVEQISTWRTIA